MEFAGEAQTACKGRLVSPIAEPPPAIWHAPIAPIRVTRTFRPGAPYTAGGHRGIDLRAEPGQVVRAPCDGVVTFRGAVAGGPPTVTLRCGTLRATLQRVRPSLSVGQAVDAGDRIGRSSGHAIDLSARRADDAYLDPAELLRGADRRVAPPMTTRRPSAPTPRAQHPAQLADRALVTPRSAPADAVPARPRPAAVDLELGLAGTALAVAALLALAVRTTRRRRAGRGVPAQVLRPRVQR